MTTKNKTKTGAASLYVVIFTTLLLGIITLGFIRIMLSESIQTSENDLSQSAYDSALAGIESAKTAVLKYHECLNTNAGGDCDKIIQLMTKANSATNCDLVREILYGENAITTGPNGEHETPIQSNTDENGAGADMDQAFTCVLISENNSEYLSQLNDNYHSKIVPLRGSNESKTAANDVNFAIIEWFSEDNGTKAYPGNTAQRISDFLRAASITSRKGTNKPDSFGSDSNQKAFTAIGEDAPAPPTVGVQLIQTNARFTYDHLNVNNGDKTDRGTLLLVPVSDEAGSIGTNYIENGADIGFAASADKAINTPIPVKCSSTLSTNGFYCRVKVALPRPYDATAGNLERNAGTSFLRLFLPYGKPDTDFSVTLCKEVGCSGNDVIPFVGIQANIDSTGRANNLIRRVQSRVELVDVYYPFPEYSVVINDVGTEAKGLNKNFWVTVNNWRSLYDSGVAP